MGEPLVTVGIVCFNGERYLGEAIESAVGQTYAPIEILVVDDGSTDRSHEIAVSFGSPVRVLRQEHAGVAAARNQVLAEYRGDLLTFLDADDRFLPHTIERAAGVLSEQPGLDAVYFMVREFVSPGVDATPFGSRDVGAARLGRMPNTMLVRRAMVARVGDYDHSLVRSQGIDWAARMFALGPATATIDEVLLERRLHTENQGIRESDRLPDYLRMLRGHLRRRHSVQEEG